MSEVLRNKQQEKYLWDLSVLYPDNASWEKDFSEIEPRLPSIEAHEGKLASSANALLSCIRNYLEVTRALEKLYTYAHLVSDQDTSNSEQLGMLQRISSLYANFSARSSYITPELMAIEDSVFEELLGKEVLSPYRRMLKDLTRGKPHVLSKAEENLLALGSEVFSGYSKTYSQLNNADLKFEDIEVDGEKVPLTHGNFSVYLKHKNRDVRKQAYTSHYKSYREHKNSISSLYASSIKKNVFLAKARKHKSARHMSLFPDAVPVEVYDKLVTTVSNNLPSLHKYYQIRKEKLALDKMYIYDTYLALVPEIDSSISYEEACEHVVASMAPLGENYCSILKEGLSSRRWVDVYENKGKRSGAYSSGCYDSYPYILMNYQEKDINDLFTLAHEAGHSMHSYLSKENQAYWDSDYTIFVAEVASTFNEHFLLEHLKKHFSADEKMLLFLLNHQLDHIKSTLYRQTMFAEFEKLSHQMAEENKPLTVESFCGAYKELLTKYFGDAVELDEDIPLECLRIPHFYSAFYVYKYATGLSAATALAEGVLKNEPEAKERYLDFLSSGGSKLPLELLNDAGVDLRTPKPVEKTLSLFSRILRQFE